MTDTTRSIVELLQTLVRIPSRAGIDAYEPVLDALAAWLAQRRIPHRSITDAGGERLGVWGRIDGGRAGPCYLLNATVDTAPFGDESRWTHAPLSAALDGGWLYGRGSGDSKAGVAIFCHVLDALMRDAPGWRGSLAFAFDADEHTGRFSGIRRFMAAHGDAMPLAGAMIGYPGNDRISVGGRGFTRARVAVHGLAAHSGSAHRPGVSAILRAARLVERIHGAPLPDGSDPRFPLPPRVSVTAIDGGNGFSVVPDRCTLDVDIRLTPAFGRDAAHALLEALVAIADAAAPEIAPTRVDWIEGWPAYRLESDAAVLRALRGSAREVLGRDLPEEVVGPSSVANFLADRRVPAINGFGVTCENIHAVDERIAVDTIAPVFEVYCRALRKLLSG